MTFYWQIKHRWLPPGFAQLVASNSMTLAEKGGWGTGTGLGARPSRLACLIRESFSPSSLTQEAEEGGFG